MDVIYQNGSQLDRELSLEIINQSLVSIEYMKKEAILKHDKKLARGIDLSLKNTLREFNHENFYYAKDSRLSTVYSRILDILYNIKR